MSNIYKDDGFYAGVGETQQSYPRPRKKNDDCAARTPTDYFPTQRPERSLCSGYTPYPSLVEALLCTHLLNPGQTGLLARLLLRPRFVENDHPLLLLEVALPRKQLPLFLGAVQDNESMFPRVCCYGSSSFHLLS